MIAFAEEIMVDSFAGGGGASLGIRWATGRDPDIAFNHNDRALAIYKANHPGTHTYCEDVWQVDPIEACAGRRVGLMWLSPDCTDHSKAKGGKPLNRKIRGLAWAVLRWINALRATNQHPRIIALENVEEFEGWGPLYSSRHPVQRLRNKRIPEKKGETFRLFVRRLRKAGYVVEWRQMRGCDYGAPTSRRRLFLIARRDGQPIVWPQPTHGKGRPDAHHVAGEIIDWSIPCPSIFLTKEEGLKVGAKRPLVENSLRRVARGVYKFVIDSPRPFIVGIDNQSSGDACAWDSLLPLGTITSKNRFALVAPTLIQIGYGEREGQAPRVPGLQKPLGTVVAGGSKHALVTAFLARHYTGVTGGSLFDPIPTITGIDHHSLVTVDLGGAVDRREQVRAFLCVYYSTDQNTGSLFDPLPTVTGNDRFALVTVEGHEFCIYDIGLRMLVPRELARGQGFPDDYKLDVTYTVTRTDKRGRQRTFVKRLSNRDQVDMIGNSVCPDLACAIVQANLTRHANEEAA